MFFTTDLAPNIMLGLTIGPGVLLNPKILRENIALRRRKFTRLENEK